MLIGYVRVSKSDGTQTLEPQRDALLAADVAAARIYEDLASGRSDARPGLQACLKSLQPGNTLVIWKLDRLGRDLRHLVNTAEDLRSRGIGLKVLAGAGAQIDTMTANGRLHSESLLRSLSSSGSLSQSARTPGLLRLALAVVSAAGRARWIEAR